ncbi:MAG: glycosyltransferase family 2 protein, partial [Bryobacteraceae bacterium]|jgi:glycosyltransferase involved in cell wall biosynthesis
MSHKVTVVTPSFNQGRFLARTVHSVLDQQFDGELEYLVRDGGSGDETVSILKGFGERIDWTSAPDGGQADAVNQALSRATGDIAGWLNSDDIYYPGAIAEACAAFDADPAADLVYGNANHIDEQDQVLEPYPVEDWNFERLISTCYLCQPAVFFRKSVVERFGGLDGSLCYAMDYEYWLRLASKGAKFLRVPGTLAGSRLYATNKTLGSRRAVHAEINDVLRRHLRRVPDRWLANYAHAVLEERGIQRTDVPRFALMVSAMSLVASLRWNRRISLRMARTVGGWTNGALRAWCRGAFRA